SVRCPALSPRAGQQPRPLPRARGRRQAPLPHRPGPPQGQPAPRRGAPALRTPRRRPARRPPQRGAARPGRSPEQTPAAEPPAAEPVKLRVFAGMTVEEVARVQGASPRTAERSWAYARARLGHELAAYGRDA